MIAPWQILAIVAALAVLFGSFALREKTVETRGVMKERAAAQKATHERTSKADAAGRKSADPAASGVRNPNYRD